MSEAAPANAGAVTWPRPDGAYFTVRSMQTKLHRWAGQDPSRRFGDLFNLVYDPAFLVHAWERVSTNKGAQTAGIDKATAAAIEIWRVHRAEGVGFEPTWKLAPPSDFKTCHAIFLTCTDALPRDSLGAYLARPGGHRIIGLDRSGRPRGTATHCRHAGLAPIRRQRFNRRFGFRLQNFADAYCSRICDSYASGDMYLASLRSGCSVEEHFDCSFGSQDR